MVQRKTVTKKTIAKKPKALPIDLEGLTRTQKVHLLELLNEYDERLRYNKITQWFPDAGPYARRFYLKHLAFFEAGSTYKERCFFGGNRTGKSTVGGLEMAFHLTGLYPDWWEGRRFEEPVNAWAVGDNHHTVRDIAQFILLGNIYDMGSGMIPKRLIVDYKVKQGVPNAIQDIGIRHVSGGVSTLSFKSYEQGRKAFQGTAQHCIWLDEECPSDIYSECLTRTMTTRGIVYLTFTPLSGLSDTVMKFLPDGKFPDGNKVPGQSLWITRVVWQDVPHLPDDEKKALEESYMPHEREARMLGLPAIGAGRIFTALEKDFVVTPFEIPAEWPRMYGMDVGWHRTAVVFAAQDPVSKTVYLYDEYYCGQELPPIHAYAVKKRAGEWMKGVIDPSSKRTRDDGKKIYYEYKQMGLNIYLADNAVEAGIIRMQNGLMSGQRKVFSTMGNLLQEYRLYRRNKRGEIEEHQEDHAMDAWRYLENSFYKLGLPVPDEFDKSNMKQSFEHRSRYLDRNDITGC